MCKTKCNMKKNVYKGSSQHPFYFSLVKPYSEKITMCKKWAVENKTMDT